MNAPSHPAGRGAADLRGLLEAFSRDLLQLLRGARMYPAGHPSLRGAAERLAASAPLQGAAELAVGVTADELLIRGQFVGGQGSRAAELASFLYRRKVLQLFWARSVTADEVVAFARVLAGTSAEGPELRKGLRAAGVSGIDTEPLDLEQLHGEVSVPAQASPVDLEERSRQAWARLKRGELTADELAAAITSADLWQAWALDDLDEAAQEALARLLEEAGAQLEAVLASLAEGDRNEALARLAVLGRSLPVGILVRLVSEEHEGWGPRSAALAGLLQGLDADRFVDLLAGMAAAEGRVTRRLAGVYRSFSPKGGTTALLPLVSARLASGDHRGFPAEVWKAVEEFVLKLDEDPFMAEEYLDSLDEISDEAGIAGKADGAPDLLEQSATHLDSVCVGLAADGGPEWRAVLVKRLMSRCEELGGLRALALVCWAEEFLPGLLSGEAAFLKSLFRNWLSRVRDASTADRQAFSRFFAAHEGALLDTALKALSDEQRIAARRFLVSVLGRSSPAVVPALVTRARAGPWYVTRNLVIVLGHVGSRRGIPVLREFLGHTHPKVRREAALALERILEPHAGRPGELSSDDVRATPVAARRGGGGPSLSGGLP